MFLQSRDSYSYLIRVPCLGSTSILTGRSISGSTSRESFASVEVISAGMDCGLGNNEGCASINTRSSQTKTRRRSHTCTIYGSTSPTLGIQLSSLITIHSAPAFAALPSSSIFRKLDRRITKMVISSAIALASFFFYVSYYYPSHA